MDRESFYKDQYDKSLSTRTEINSSLSTPIGILTALLAGLYFCATNFDYDDDRWLTKVFLGVGVIATGLVITAIIYLILAFADFLRGRRYININDAAVLDEYYTDLLDFYDTNPPPAPNTPEDQAKSDFDAYLLAELVRNASTNQRINRIKTALLFQSHKFMIYGIIALSLLIVPFGIDFGHNRGKDKVQHVKLDQELPVNLTIKYQKDTTERLLIKLKDHGKARTDQNKANTAAKSCH